MAPKKHGMIRRYEPRDEAAVLAVWEGASAGAHPFLDPEFIADERVRIARDHLPVAETWVWDERGVVRGFVALLGREVGAIFVDPKAQGRGIGRALMDHARTLKGRLELDVFEANTIGRRFYAAYGFVCVGRDVHQETGQPLLRLALDGVRGPH